MDDGYGKMVIRNRHKMKKSNVIKFRTAYNKPVFKPFHTTGSSLTEQQWKDHNNVSVLMQTYTQTKDPSIFQRTKAFYGDYTNIGDYESCLNQVIEAKESFDSLPSDLRAKFRNDPRKFYEFVTDPANQDKLQDIGLTDKPKSSAISPEKTEKASVASPDPKNQEELPKPD